MKLIELYTEYMKPMKGSEKFHRWSFITVVSALLERRSWLDLGRLGILFPNQYTILVGPPATGKGFSAGFATSFLENIAGTAAQKSPAIGPTKITQAALYKELKDATRECIITGKGAYKQSPLFIYAAELAINMSDFGGGTLTNEMIDFYDSKSHAHIAKKRTISDETLSLHNPSLTLLGCTTEDFLRSAANDKLITSGLASRIVFVVETERVEKMREDVQEDKEARKYITQQLQQIYSMRGPMVLEADAKKHYISLAEVADELCLKIPNAFLQNYFGRKPDHLCKLAMAFAATESRYKISKADLELAESWLAEIEPSMLSAFGVRNIEKDDDAVCHIIKLIPAEPEYISRSELLRKLMSFGKFMPQNGSWEAMITSLRNSRSIKIQTVGESDELYSMSKVDGKEMYNLLGGK